MSASGSRSPHSAGRRGHNLLAALGADKLRDFAALSATLAGDEDAATLYAMIRETQFGADVELDLLLPEEQTQGFLERVTDLSAGTIEGLIGKQEYRAFPLP